MPIEIKELVIKTSIQEESSQIPSLQNSEMETATPEFIITECVEQVMEILKQKEER